MAATQVWPPRALFTKSPAAAVRIAEVRARLTVSLGALAASLAACGEPEGGGAGTATQQATQPQKAACLKVPSAARQAIEEALKGDRRISKTAAVRAEGAATGLADIREEVYFVTADVQPNPGLATWAFGREAFRTGGGIIIAVGPAARAVTDFGVDIAPDRLEEWGLTQSAEGYRASQECLGRAG